MKNLITFSFFLSFIISNIIVYSQNNNGGQYKGFTVSNVPPINLNEIAPVSYQNTNNQNNYSDPTRVQIRNIFYLLSDSYENLPITIPNGFHNAYITDLKSICVPVMALVTSNKISSITYAGEKLDYFYLSVIDKGCASIYFDPNSNEGLTLVFYDYIYNYVYK